MEKLKENKLHIFQGRIPGKLSKEGLVQARKLALRLKEERIDFIYASDLCCEVLVDLRGFGIGRFGFHLF